MKIMVIAPHPDDEVLGCGGSIARHVSRGDEVGVLVVTRAVPDLLTDEEISHGRAEMKRAHDLLGVTFTDFLDFPAPELDTMAESRIAQAIATKLGSFRPECVYVPHYGDIHIDHMITHRAALVACRPINNSSVRRLLAYETLSETEWSPGGISDAFVPNVFNDVSAHLETKLDAMRCYKSQLREAPHPRSIPILSALARFRGATVGVGAAEAFMLIREIHADAGRLT